MNEQQHVSTITDWSNVDDSVFENGAESDFARMSSHINKQSPTRACNRIDGMRRGVNDISLTAGRSSHNDMAHLEGFFKHDTVKGNQLSDTLNDNGRQVLLNRPLGGKW